MFDSAWLRLAELMTRSCPQDFDPPIHLSMSDFLVFTQASVLSAS